MSDRSEYTQHAIFAETWELGGGMLKPLSLVDGDGPASQYDDPRYDRDAWLARVGEMERQRPSRMGNGPFGGKTIYYRNHELRARTVTVEVGDWTNT